MRLSHPLSRACLTQRSRAVRFLRHYTICSLSHGQRQQSLQLWHIVPPEGDMREPALVDPVMMYQWQVDVTEQQNVRRDSRVRLFHGIRAHLTSDGPRWNKLFKAGRLSVPRNIMRPPKMIQSCGVPFHTVHQDTGHRHNCAKSKWNFATCRYICRI